MSKKLIVILGPTASGKTAFSIELAKYVDMAMRQRVMVSLSNHEARDTLLSVSHFDRLNMTQVEIINADSRQLYKHMDIGTAKIHQEEMMGVPHHLFSVLDPKTQTNISWYKKEAMRIIDDIHARGKVAMLVGGSMLYISSIIDGLQPILRIESNGQPSIKRSKCPYDLPIIGMKIPREELYARINARTKTLLNSVWIEEVMGLLEKGYTVDDPGMEACGYREIAAAISNHQSPITQSPIISAKIRQYAKRQMTWWRQDQRIRWVNPVDLPQSLLEDLQVFCEYAPRYGHTHSPVPCIRDSMKT